MIRDLAAIARGWRQRHRHIATITIPGGVIEIPLRPILTRGAVERLAQLAERYAADTPVRGCGGPGSHETPGPESREGQDAPRGSRGTTGPCGAEGAP